MISGARADRMWIAGGIVVALVVALTSWLLLIGPKLDDTAAVREQTGFAQDQNAVLQIKVAKLRADSAGMDDLLRSLDALHTQLPTTSGLDELTRQLAAQAAGAGVTLTSVVVGVPTVVQANAGAGPADSDTSAAADGPSPDGSAPASTDAGSSTGPPAKPAAAAQAPEADLYAIPVTISTDGSLANQQALLDAIQTQGPRAALISTVQFASAPEAADGAGGNREATAPGREQEAAERQSGEATGSLGDVGSAAPGGGVSAALATRTTMTVQLAVFVAPQSPEDEAALRQQLGG